MSAMPKPMPKSASSTTKAAASKGKQAPRGSPIVAKKTKQTTAMPSQAADSRHLDQELLKAAKAASKSAPQPLARNRVRVVCQAVRRVLVAAKVISGAEKALAILGRQLRFTGEGAKVFDALLREQAKAPVPVAKTVVAVAKAPAPAVKPSAPVAAKPAAAKPKAAPAAAKSKSNSSAPEKLTDKGLDSALLAAAKKGLSGQGEGEPVGRRVARTLCREVSVALKKGGGRTEPAATNTLIHLQKSVNFTKVAAQVFGRIVQRELRAQAKASKIKLSAGKAVAQAKTQRKAAMVKARRVK